jgi:MFS family permease
MFDQSLHYIKFFLSNELNALYTSAVLRNLAFSMVGIFLPLYLYIELNYSLAYVILFFLLYSVFYALFSFPSSKLVDLLSFKYIVLLSSPIYILYFVLLYYLKFNPILFFIVPSLLGVVDSFFWLGFHLEFSGASDYKRRGKEVGNWYNLTFLAGLAGPLIGGGILLFSGFTLLFFVVSGLLFGGAVPMFFTKYKNKRLKVNFKRVFNFKHLRDAISFAGHGGVMTVAGVFWPIFIFGFLGGYLKLGSLATGVALVTLIYTMFIGKLSDRYDRRMLVKLGSLFNSVMWVMRFFIKNSLHVVGLYFFGGLTAITADLPFSALTYDKSKRREEYFVLREISLSLGRIVLLLLVLWIGNLKSSFLLASVFSLLYMFL